MGRKVGQIVQLLFLHDSTTEGFFVIMVLGYQLLWVEL